MRASDPLPEDPEDSTSRKTPPDLDAFYRAEAPWLVRFFRRQLRDPVEAQDLAHETMLRFIDHGAAARVDSPQAYLRRIAANLLRNQNTSGTTRLARLTFPLAEGLDQEVGIDQHQIVASQDELAHWQAILSTLKPRTLEIFLLSRVDGLTYNQIAAQLGMTIWNVKRHMLVAIRHVTRHQGNR